MAIEKRRDQRSSVMGEPERMPPLGEALTDYARSLSDGGKALADSLIGPAWRRAYGLAGRPCGVISPEEGYRLAGLYQRELKAEMRRVCSRFASAQLFFAVRFWSPGVVEECGLDFCEERPPKDATIGAMALRRIAANAALLYGRPSPKGYVTASGGDIPPEQEKRFARAFVSLLMLSHAYLPYAWGLRPLTAMGYRAFVDANGMRYLEEDAEELDLLTYSKDNRGHRSYNLLARLGEFEQRAVPVLEPQWESGREALGDRPALFTAHYERDSKGQPGYRIRAEPVKPVEDLLLELERLDPGPAVAAWGMGYHGFVAVLGGFSEMLKERMVADWIFEGAPGAENVTMIKHVFWGATVPFAAAEFEEEGKGTLVDHVERYAKSKGFDLDRLDLLEARDRFLELAVSTGKPEVEDDSGNPLGISVGDGRYSYLLHRFGRVYIADLFHADHWLNRPLDMLHDKMKGEAGDLKGRRVEDRVWDFMGGSDKIEPVGALRNTWVRSTGKNQQYNDLDCPLRVGDVLVLAEVKGKYMARAPESFARPDLVERRWKENRKFLNKIDETARLLALRKGDATFREALEGVRCLLPVVVRPYREWVADLEDGHWLRKPSRTDVGVPRVLTPPELKEFLENTTADELVNLPGGFVVDLKSA